MTSDAKVGLLLGLVFIVIIAFLLNGLPGLLANGGSEGPVKTTVPYAEEDFGLSKKAEEAINIARGFNPDKLRVRDTSVDNDDRFEDAESVGGGSKSEEGSGKKQAVDTKKYYVVKPGDSLGKIARKVYGDNIGNKQATVDKIYQANSNILTSADDIKVDQKLVMPRLDVEGNLVVQEGEGQPGNSQKTGQDTLMDTGFFEKVGGSIKNVFAKKDKSKASSLSAEYSLYVAKEGDNLWSISSSQLGNGSKWREIQKINNGILKGSIEVTPGMKLKIPKN